MKRVLVLLLVAAAAATAALAIPASASAGVVVGIADQKPDMFLRQAVRGPEDPSRAPQRRLGRAAQPWQRQELDRWLFLATLNARRAADQLRPLAHQPALAAHARAHAQGVPAVPQALPVGRRRSRPGTRPTTAASRSATSARLVAAVLARDAAGLPLVHGSSRPSCSTCRTWPTRSGASCTRAQCEPQVVGPAQLRRGQPLPDDAPAQLLRRVKGQVWLTEVGGIVKRRHEEALHGQAHPRVQTRTRDRVTRFLFDEVVAAQPRASRRVYLYHWNSSDDARHAGTRRSSAPTASAGPRSTLLPIRSCATRAPRRR